MRTALLVMTALAATLIIACGGGDGDDQPSAEHEHRGIQFSDPSGSLSVDASAGDNTAASVGPIGATADVTDATCNDGNPEISVDLVMGDADGNGVSDGSDIAGWQARIKFDPEVLTFAGFQVSDSAEGAQFYMEKASDHTASADDHIRVVNPQPEPGIGTFDIGSAVIGNPPGASGVGLLATLLFDCVASGGSCIDIGDADNSFYTDIGSDDRHYEQRSGAGLGVNGGTPPTDCAQTED